MKVDSSIRTRPSLRHLLAPAAGAVAGTLIGPILVSAFLGGWSGLLQAASWGVPLIAASLLVVGLGVHTTQVRVGQRGIGGPSRWMGRHDFQWDDVQSIWVWGSRWWSPKIVVESEDRRIYLSVSDRIWLAECLDDLSIDHPRAKELRAVLATPELDRG